METTWRWLLVTAIAPIAWGSTYFVTREYLPADSPLWGAALRALPAGLVLLAIRPRMPRGPWWWRSLVLGVLNVSVFFALVYLAAQLLPTSLASTVMATSPVVMMLFAWMLAGERLRVLPLVGAGVGIAGVVLLLATDTSSVDWTGIAASVAAMVLSSLGFILAKRWRDGTDVRAVTAWQFLAGGLLLLPAALLVEGAPPPLDVPALLGFAYVSVFATAVAFAAWFTGLAHLPAGTVGLVGLLNPVTGVLLGTLVAGEVLGPAQLVGLVLVLAGILLGQPLVARAFGRRTTAGGRVVAERAPTAVAATSVP
jgi:probable blue pigment (indigoidine) exporter